MYFWGLQRSKINLTDKMKRILEKGLALYDGHSQLLTVHSKINILFSSALFCDLSMKITLV